MPTGDIKLNKLRIGAMDLTDPELIMHNGFNISEDIYNIYGPSAEIYVNDFNDLLGRTNFTGKEDIFIDFSLVDTNDSLDFKFKCFENVNLDDQTSRAAGAMKSKTYDVRAISVEYLNAQARANIQKSYDMPIHKAMEDFVKKTALVSPKPYLCDDPTKGPVRHLATGNPSAVYQQLNDRAVSIANKSSAYVLFVSDNKYRYCTIEQLCRYPPIVKLRQTNTLGMSGTTEEQKRNSIIEIIVNTSFYTPPRAKSITQQSTYDTVTGKATYPKKNPFSGFIHLGNPVFRENSTGNPFLIKEYTQHDRSNNKQSTDIAEARQNRAAYLAYLAQNNAELIVPGNPKIKLGSVIHLTIPNKSTEHYGYVEKQFTGLALVTHIKHIIRPLGVRPQYIMKLRVTKAGGYEEGGE